MSSLFCSEQIIKSIKISDERTIKFREEFKRKNWFFRTFSPLTPGSIRGSILSLSGMLLGVGVLALPKVSTDCGLLFGLLFIGISAITGYWSLIVMM